MDRVRVFVSALLERRLQPLPECGELRLVDLRRARALAVCGGGFTGTASENEEVRQRIAAEAVRAMHARRDLARRVQPGHRRGFRIRVDADAAHDVVKRRTDLHLLLRDVDIGQFLELVVHRRQAAPDVLGRPARRDVEEHAAMLGPPTRLHLGVDRTRDLVTREQVGRAAVVPLVFVPGVRLLLRVGGVGAEELGDVPEHEALTGLVAQRAAVPPDALGDEEATDRRRPDHASRMELGHLHVDEVGARFDRHRDPVAGVLPRVRRDPPRLADAARSEDDGLRAERDELAGLAPVPNRAAHALSVGKQVPQRAFHEDVNVLRDGGVLERADHLETGAVADVREPRVTVAAEVALQDETVLGAVEESAPFLELEHAVRRFLRVQLRHAPVVQELAAAHGVAEVDLPVVLGPDVAERRGDAAFGHDRVRLAEERLADDRRLRAKSVRFDRGTQPRAAGADDDHVVLVALDL